MLGVILIVQLLIVGLGEAVVPFRLGGPVSLPGAEFDCAVGQFGDPFWPRLEKSDRLRGASCLLWLEGQ